jgi:hypothetical protein
MVSRENLDKKICNVEQEVSNNTQTYREFIVESELEFSMAPEPINSYSDEQLQEYVEELDYLWTK